MLSVSVVGLGKLGFPLSLCLAKRGFLVTGIDKDETLVAELNTGSFRHFEPQVAEFWNGTKQHLHLTTNLQRAILESSITFVIVPTPTDLSGKFSIRYLRASVQEICSVLKEKQEGRHLIVITSTVLPGDMERHLLPLVREFRAQASHLNLGICYQPWFVALGNVCEGILAPSMIVIGEERSEDGELLSGLHQSLCGEDVVIRRMNFINAEITKIAINSFITTKISFANMLGTLCAKLPGANIDTVTWTMQLDPRLGTGYLKAGGSYGGPCFPRDSKALASILRDHRLSTDLPVATDAINERMNEDLVSLVLNELEPNGKVAVLGLAYKSQTAETEASSGVYLLEKLKSLSVEVVGHDPIVRNSDLSQCLAETDIAIICTPWPEYSQLPLDTIDAQKRPRVLIDCWRILKPNLRHLVSKYIGIGSFPSL